MVANVNWTVSRSTPTVVVDDHHDHDLLIIGVYGPASVVAVKRSTGELVWSTQLDQNPAAVITMSGTYYKGLVFFFFFLILFQHYRMYFLCNLKLQGSQLNR